MLSICDKIARMSLLLPPLNAVRAFVVAARHQSFTLAAGELHVTHSAISRQIKTLETHLGVRLFERRVRQVSLTVEGLRFYSQANAALQQLLAATEAVMAPTPSRVVRINVRPSFAVRWLIPRLPDFVEQYPGIEPHVLTSTLSPDKADERFDVAIRRGHSNWPATMELQPFLEDEICLVVSPTLLASHPLAQPGALTQLVMLWSKTRKGDWQSWLTSSGAGNLKPAGQMQFDHVHFVMQAAIDGLGFAVVPTSLAASAIAAGQLLCPFPEQRLAVNRYYYGLAPDAVPQAQFFSAWLQGYL
jgi:LysR family glycine cleavage system transcriptional activator